MAKSRLQSIDCLRGIAALTVCFGHAIVAFRWPAVSGWWFQLIARFMSRYGGLGVPLFFVISGFCIHLTAARNRATSGTPNFRFGAFWKRRMWRLYPTYFVVLCATMSLVVLQYFLNPAAPILAEYPQPKPTWMTLDFVSHVFMLHGFVPLFDHGAGNPPFWTLAREEYLYVLYPVVLLFQSWLGVGWTGLAIAVIGTRMGPLLASLGVGTGPADVIVASVLPAWIQWYLGALAAEIYCGGFTAPRIFRSLWTVPLWMVAAEQLPGDYLIFYGLAFFTLINAVVGLETSGRWPRHAMLRFLTWLGFMSYSFYLVHDPTQAVVGFASGRIGTFDTPVLYLARAAFMVVASIAVARILFLACESRFLEGRRKPIPQPAAALGEVVALAD